MLQWNVGIFSEAHLPTLDWQLSITLEWYYQNTTESWYYPKFNFPHYIRYYFSPQNVTAHFRPFQIIVEDVYGDI